MTFQLKLIFLQFWFIGAAVSSLGQANFYEKINGVSLVAPQKETNYAAISELKTLGANYITLMPYAFVNETSGKVEFNLTWQWWGEKSEGIIQGILQAKKSNLKVMIKPMLWLKGGAYTGDLSFNSVANWDVFESTYKNYILHFAKIADSLNADIFCVGTEMKSFLQFKPNFFSDFIDELNSRAVQFKVTYAANWDNYQNVTFWHKTNFIGIDAYFPGAVGEEPSVSQIKTNWVKIKFELKDFSEVNQLPILFTEYGFRSCTNCTQKPWQHQNHCHQNQICQSNALEAFYHQLYHQPWCAGGFIWKWYASPQDFPADMATDFSPQNKQALQIIKNQLK